jgi:hypothetical protein
MVHDIVTTLRYIDKHSIAIGGYLFIIPTHAQILQYYYFTPIRISAFRMPSSGGDSVKSIDYTSIV